MQADAHRTWSFAAGALAKLDSDVRTAVIQTAVLPLMGTQGKLVTCVEAGFPLQESEVYQQRRRDAVEQLESIKQAMSIMESIQSSQATAAAAQASHSAQLSTVRFKHSRH